jgi:hypothetical protein
MILWHSTPQEDMLKSVLLQSLRGGTESKKMLVISFLSLLYLSLSTIHYSSIFFVLHPSPASPLISSSLLTPYLQHMMYLYHILLSIVLYLESALFAVFLSLRRCEKEREEGEGRQEGEREEEGGGEKLVSGSGSLPARGGLQSGLCAFQCDV